VAAGDGSVLIGVDGCMNYIGKMVSFQLVTRGHGLVFVINFEGKEKPPSFPLAFRFKDGGRMFLLPSQWTVPINLSVVVLVSSSGR
jgi:hypothetical protein